MSDVTRAEVCAAAVADVFRGDGEALASAFGTVPTLGARLAKLTSEPDLLMTDGVAFLRSDVAPLSGGNGHQATVEGWLPFRRVFELLWNGRRHVVMTASQIDRYGNHNFACIGPHERPKVQLLGMRGAPGNTINHPTSYWVPNHTRKVFVEQVDCVSGVGYDRAAKLGPSAAFHHIHRVVSNLGVFDFETPDKRMRLASLHPGVSVEEVVEATSFELAIDGDPPQTRLPDGDELQILREVLDPERYRDREVPGH